MRSNLDKRGANSELGLCKDYLLDRKTAHTTPCYKTGPIIITRQMNNNPKDPEVIDELCEGGSNGGGMQE